MSKRGLHWVIILAALTLFWAFVLREGYRMATDLDPVLKSVINAEHHRIDDMTRSNPN